MIIFNYSCNFSLFSSLFVTILAYVQQVNILLSWDFTFLCAVENAKFAFITEKEFKVLLKDTYVLQTNFLIFFQPTRLFSVTLQKRLKKPNDPLNYLQFFSDTAFCTLSNFLTISFVKLFSISNFYFHFFVESTSIL